MKYENIESANKICDEIDFLNEKLNILNEEDPPLVQIWNNGQKIEINMSKNDNEFLPLAEKMIDGIKENLTQKIKDLKAQLELL